MGDMSRSRPTLVQLCSPQRQKTVRRSHQTTMMKTGQQSTTRSTTMRHALRHNRTLSHTHQPADSLGTPARQYQDRISPPPDRHRVPPGDNPSQHNQATCRRTSSHLPTTPRHITMKPYAPVSQPFSHALLLHEACRRPPTRPTSDRIKQHHLAAQVA